MTKPPLYKTRVVDVRLRLTEQDLKLLGEQVRDRGIPMGAVVRDICRQYFTKQRSDKKDTGAQA